LKERRGATGDTAHDQPEVRFEEDLYEPFYGGRQFSIRDPNGLALIFWHPEWLTPHDESAPGG
jgi:hypothetical protein